MIGISLKRLIERRLIVASQIPILLCLCYKIGTYSGYYSAILGSLLFRGNNSLSFSPLPKGGQCYLDFSFDGSDDGFEAWDNFDDWEFANHSDRVLTKVLAASTLFAEKPPLIFSQVSWGGDDLKRM